VSMMREDCIVCGSEDLVHLAFVERVPISCNTPAPSKRAALDVERGDIALTGCRGCGHVFNRAFDPDRIAYGHGYENALDFSPRFRRYAEETVRRLVGRHGLQGRRIAEIGCGHGAFLRQVCEAGGNHGTGFDPGRPDGPEEQAGAGTIRILGRPYRAEDGASADLVCARHVLEHFAEPMTLLRMIAAGRRDLACFIEVPDGSFTLDRLGIWDLIYEHVSYFTPSSLGTALRQAGFSVNDMQSSFGGQFLWAEAFVASSPEPMIKVDDRTLSLFETYPDRHRAMVGAWADFIENARLKHRRIALWGAGSKGITFLNVLGVRAGQGIDLAVDINPRKTGTHVAGTGQRIVQPSDLAAEPPDLVLIMNPEYTDEIAGMLAAVGVAAEIQAVSGCLPA
jgi:SAM-dependent methyltransferase